MLQILSDDLLSDHLLRIARDPELRTDLYDRLGEYCHQCRNRLNSLKLSLYLVVRQAGRSSEAHWSAIEGHYQALEQRVDQIQSLCRPLTLSRVTLPLDLLMEDRRASWTQTMVRSGRSLELIHPEERGKASFDVERLGAGLDALVAWRAGDFEAGSAATIRWWHEADQVHLVWEESGMPPISAALAGSADLSTWTLPLLVRVILAHGGDYRVDNEGGYRLEFTWPSALPTP